jgi:hypothetical protein
MVYLFFDREEKWDLDPIWSRLGPFYQSTSVERDVHCFLPRMTGDVTRRRKQHWSALG